MTVVGKKILNEFAREHADARAAIAAWTAEVEVVTWKASQDVKRRFPSASFTGEGRVVFNLKGNHYRLDVQIDYITKVVLIRRIGTHAEYDTWKF
jgi:mRNA interferase HigB